MLSISLWSRQYEFLKRVRECGADLLLILLLIMLEVFGCLQVIMLPPERSFLFCPSNECWGLIKTFFQSVFNLLWLCAISTIQVSVVFSVFVFGGGLQGAAISFWLPLNQNYELKGADKLCRIKADADLIKILLFFKSVANYSWLIRNKMFHLISYCTHKLKDMLKSPDCLVLLEHCHNSMVSLNIAVALQNEPTHLSFQFCNILISFFVAASLTQTLAFATPKVFLKE